MPREYYFGNRPDQSGSLSRKILMFVYLGAMIAAVIIFAWISLYNNQVASRLSTFQSAIDAAEYESALETYRDIQAEILTKDPNDLQGLEREKTVLQEMEQIVFSRCDGILNRIRQEKYSPNADDRAFLEQMGELTGARLTVWLNQICEEFLLGTIEKPTITFVLNQVSDYQNVAAAAKPLVNELDLIEKSRGDILDAEDYFESKSYILAAEIYEDLISRTKGFVNEYARRRLQSCEKEMYEPIMEECDHLLKTFRYYTAEEILSDMARIFPDDQKVQAKLLEATSNTSLVVEYKGSVEVLCVKPLIVDPVQAFSGDQAIKADSIKLTAGEFQKILEQLYEKDFILVDVRSMTDRTNLFSVEQQSLRLPEGKKPVVIVLEDVNYSAYLKGMGTCSRLVIDENGNVAGEYQNASGQTIVSRGAEAIGILDSFVELHPDFSFDGAKGIISFSGYETTMGYITDKDQIDDRNTALAANGFAQVSLSTEEIRQNQETVSMIVDVLEDTGWIFGSSTYGFINANSCEMDVIQTDTEKWMSQIGTLLGDVEILVYPNGDFIKGSDPRCVYLKESGFRIFFGVGPSPYYTFGSNYLYLDRIMLNGATLRNTDLSRLFSLSYVYESQRPVELP